METIMKFVHPMSFVVAMAGLLAVGSPIQAQPSSETTFQQSGSAHAVSRSDDLEAEGASGGWQDSSLLRPFDTGSGLYAGADFLFVRPHFSEAVAFARGNQTLATYQTEGRPLAFSYDPSFRVFAGHRFDNGQGAIQFTYWHFRGGVSVDGTAPGIGQFIVDPFGNIVGTVAVIDPRDARFGTVLVGGDLIRTRATVEMNVYDVDLVRSIFAENPRWDFHWSAGVRIADVDQFYESAVTLAGNPVTRGDFSADFIGAGPRLGIEGRRCFGAQGRFSVFAHAYGSLLLGTYDVRSSNSAVPLGFSASQREHMTRTIPVVETELGGTWDVTDLLSLSAGWLFQAWFDMGTSGGTFGGFFAGTDDANIMSFDGLFVKAERKF
jgi:hypothetical protein